MKKTRLVVAILCALLLIVSCSDNNVFRIDRAICKVNGKGYASLQEAVNEVVRSNKSGSLIQVIRDVDKDVRSLNRDGVVVPASFKGNLTIDFNGYEYVLAEDSENLITVLGGNIVVMNGRISNENPITPVYKVDDASLTVRNVRLSGGVSRALELTNNAKATIYGEEKSSSFIFGKVALDSSSSLVLDGGQYRINEYVNIGEEEGSVSIISGYYQVSHFTEPKVREIISRLSADERKNVEIEIIHDYFKKGGINPTCTEEGSILYYECSGCHKLFSDYSGKNEIRLEDTVLLPLRHKIEHRLQKDATCTDMGNLEHWGCVRCGKYWLDSALTAEAKYMEVYSSPLGHDLPEMWTIDSESTCLHAGSRSKTCSRCGEKKTEDIPKLEHLWPDEWIVEKDPTCSSDGSKIKTCSNCGTVERVKLDKLEHIWPEDWTVDKEATCTETGLKSKNCTLCGQKQSQIIEKIAHSEGQWKTNPEGHWKECTVCNTRLFSASHTFGNWVINREEGKKRRTCTVCSYLEEEFYHELIRVEAKTPNCTESGNLEYWKCSVHNNEYFSDKDAKTPVSLSSVTLAPLGHNKGTELKVDFETHYYECTRCNERLEEEAHKWKCNTDKFNHELHLQTCVICGRIDSLTTYGYDETYHWETCSVNGDWNSEKKNVHCFVDGVCVICNKEE